MTRSSYGPNPSPSVTQTSSAISDVLVRLNPSSPVRWGHALRPALYPQINHFSGQAWLGWPLTPGHPFIWLMYQHRQSAYSRYLLLSRRPLVSEQGSFNLRIESLDYLSTTFLIYYSFSAPDTHPELKPTSSDHNVLPLWEHLCLDPDSAFFGFELVNWLTLTSMLCPVGCPSLQSSVDFANADPSPRPSLA